MTWAQSLRLLRLRLERLTPVRLAEMPSSKWWASTLVTAATLLVVMVTAAQDDGVALPEWLVLAGAILGPIVTYLKPENRPSVSAKRALGFDADGRELPPA